MCNDVYIMMYRTQITLDPELQHRARKRAQALGISFSDYVRRLLARDLDASAAETLRADTVFDLGDSGRSDVARGKDAMVGEAVTERRK
ncbi:MAG TPA: hypothetical protein VFG91_13305 [Woeseiaceae bacterium]|nr:hypothetical protein [Woeseiaceae bacterium]